MFLCYPSPNLLIIFFTHLPFCPSPSSPSHSFCPSLILLKYMVKTAGRSTVMMSLTSPPI